MLTAHLRKASYPLLLLALLFLIGSWALLSASKTDTPGFTVHEKAAYLDPNLANFIRPGLMVRITSAEIAQDGTIRARVKVTDPMGVPLDRLGATTPGPVAMSLMVAHIPKDQEHYEAYTMRTQTSPITGQSAQQPTADSGGTWAQVGDGEYTYTFRTRAPSGLDRTATHSIGVWATRDLNEFDLGIQRTDHVFHFVPDGSDVAQVRDIVKTDTCNKCHDPLALHGGARQSVQLCILCHYPGVLDPDTGNSVDMRVMAHKIHMGANLPSVKAGQPYQIIGFGQSIHDYSDVQMPSDVRRCTHCHEQEGPRAATQAHRFLTNPSRAACGSCHENVNFATGEGHVNLPQVSDARCSTCHTPQGELPFDASIMGAHVIPEESELLPGLVYEIKDVSNAGPGQNPTVTFSVKNKNGEPVDISRLTRLFMVAAGSTTDYGPYFSEDVRQAQAAGGGDYRYTFARALPEDATGSWTVGLEGYNNFTLLPGTKKELTVRDAGKNVVKHFSVDGSPLQARRQVVSLEKCNDCHGNLSLHGGNRNTVEQCVLCHNPTVTDRAVRPADQMPAESIQMANMIHKIHTGHEIGEEDYTIYGRGSVAHNYNHVGYPGDRRNCNACHVNDSQSLPLPQGLRPVQDPRGLVDPMLPATAACLGCHTGMEAAAHTQLQTHPTLGESCSTCHGANRDASVNRSHAR